MSRSVATVSMTVELPSDSYLRIQQLAKALGTSESHAAALTIFAGQQAQTRIDAADDLRHTRHSPHHNPPGDTYAL